MNGHKVYRFEGVEGEENAVWTEPLKRMSHGLLGGILGHAPTLTAALAEITYDDLMPENLDTSANRAKLEKGCFGLNPPGERQTIWTAVHAANQLSEEQEQSQVALLPTRGCYPPIVADLKRFRRARGHPGGYSRPPHLPDRWFWSASPSPYNAGGARDFDAGDGGVDYGSRGYSRAVFCRCVGPAW